MIEPIFDIGVKKECEKCNRFSKAKNPYMKTRGKGQKKILIVLNSPTEGDDKRGTILSGETKTALADAVRLMGYNLERDFWITAGVKCFSDKNATELSYRGCRKKLKDEIEELNPVGVFLMGSEAIKVAIGNHIDESSEYAMSGLKIPYEGRFYYPLFSPKFLISKKFDENFKSYFKRTFKEAVQHSETYKIVPSLNPYEYVTPLTSFSEVKKLFKMLENYDKAVAFDYETTGKKPFKKGHKITSMGMATEDGEAYSFPLEYPKAWTPEQLEEIKEMIREFLTNGCYKIAHGASFEIIWSKAIFGVTPFINWCSMTMQHLINTQVRCGLKAQAFYRWGVSGYDDDAAPFIKAVEGSDFNRMEEMPLLKQLFYVGIDAFLTMKLFLEQEVELEYNPKGADFFNLGINVLSDVTYNGINCDLDWYNQKEKELNKQIKNLEEELYESQEVIKHMNNKGLSNWEYNSTKQVTELLIETLNLTTDEKTSKGNISCTEKVLNKMNHWIPQHIVKLRKLLKLRDTYLAQFTREMVDGKIHPDFPLHVARSLRSSSRNPNFQNLPKREKEAKTIVRKGLKPLKGNKLAEIDFSGIEVSTSVLYHKDPVFLHYLENEHADMHRDNAVDIWKSKSDNIAKMVRFYAKNCWTFPQFYGDYYASCAIALWENRFEKLNDGTTCIDNLKKKGIKTYKQFVDHLKECEDILWKKRFKVYTQWKNDIQKKYQKEGFIETYFGFRYSGYLDKKQTANYPIQGTAFHILLWCLIRINSIAKKEKWKSKIIGQIHDSMIFDLNPSEEHHVLKTVKYVCEVEVVERFDWITTPFKVDIEMSEVDGSFAELEDYEWKEVE